MTAASDTTFFSDNLDDEVTFHKDESGVVTGLTLKRGWEEFEAHRLPLRSSPQNPNAGIDI
jgi:hypothetical protein